MEDKDLLTSLLEQPLMGAVVRLGSVDSHGYGSLTFLDQETHKHLTVRLTDPLNELRPDGSIMFYSHDGPTVRGTPADGVLNLVNAWIAARHYQ